MIDILWTTDFFVTGNALGYSIHNRMMREHVGKFANLTPDAPVAVSVLSADKFERIPGKFNFLFTMFEAADLPATYIRKLRFADHIIVPCEQNRELFAKYVDLPISVCPEGADASVFTFKKRDKPVLMPFRFLWLGAPNPRKGYLSVKEAWNAFLGDPRFELYLKTTSPEGLAKNEHAAAMLNVARQEPIQNGNIIFDARKVELDELVDLYHSAHCFLMPSIGEGWGLTLCEALCTGLPSIATRWGGHEMFFDEKVGFPIKHEMKSYYIAPYELPTHVAIPDTLDLVRLMKLVYNRYDYALEKAQRGSNRIKSVFNWDNAARILVDIVRKGYYEREEQWLSTAHV